MKHFLIDKNYSEYLSSMGYSVVNILKNAELPTDLFSKQTPVLTTEEYFRFMQAVDNISNDTQAPVLLATCEGIEAFSPPIFAAYCSKDGLSCLKRLAQYKPLIGALLYKISESDTEVIVEILSADENLSLPEILIGIEFVFIVNLLRKATKINITPVRASFEKQMLNKTYGEFIGTPIIESNKNIIVFNKSDTKIPFVSRNESMWEFLKPELNKKLAVTEIDNSYAARVRSALMELLPSSECTIDAVSKKLGYSKRTLQRKLKDENTNFQKQLNHTRELLAKTYIANTDMSAEDIAFLLGYNEISSFIRAFTVWTGQSVNDYKKSLNKS